MNIRVAHAKLIVKEVASYEYPRIHGVSNLNAFSDGWRVLRTILYERYLARGRMAPETDMITDAGSLPRATLKLMSLSTTGPPCYLMPRARGRE